MRKALTLIAMSLVAVAATAQDRFDALTFSQNTYQGTARSIGMGNAMTAMGGDLGSIGINPAGSAVAGYGQVTVTPNVTLATTKANYTSVYGEPYSSSYNDSFSRATLPNIGMMFNWTTGRSRGIKSWSFGMVSNNTNDFTSTVYSAGYNAETSMLGAFATAASLNGYSSSQLASSDSYYTTYAPWTSIAAYQSGMIATYGGSEYNYIGATEKLFDDGTIALAGELEQIYGFQRTGSKHDIVLNWGANINDVFFVGVNLGITTLSYQSDMYFKEKAVNPNDFNLEYDNGKVAYFDNSRYRFSYNAEGDGVYLKVGFISKPLPGLRIGGAIQTPTTLTVKELYQYACDVNFTDSQYDGYATSPEGEYQYRLVSPYRANLGVAYNILGVAMISADYEMCDYSTMKYKVFEGNDNSEFYDTNKSIQDYCGMSHMIRVGVEYKPLPQYAIRAGYNYSTSGEYTSDNGVNKKSVANPTTSYSFGLGYSSKGSFFADVAYRLNKYPSQYIQPYDDYIDNLYSPEIQKNQTLHNIVATVGFRF